MRDLISICERYLTELNGVKNSDEMAALKDMDSQFSRNDSAPIVGYQRRNAMFGYMQVLKDKGFVPLGAGGYGCVFTHPGLDYAVKIFEADPAYLTFVKYALANQGNPHLPKFRGKFTKLHNNWYAVRVGLLTPLPENQRKEVAEAMEAVGGAYPEDADEEFSALFAKYPQLRAAMNGVIRVCSVAKARVDVVGSGNILGREGVPVLSDPVAPR